MPFEGGNQAEIVEHGRAKEKSDVADGFDGGFGDGFYLGDLRLRDAVLGWHEFRELPDFDKERAERLADFIMKFAGDGATLFFLGFDEAGGEAFQIETAAGESLITQAGLTLEAQDVPATDE